MPPGILHRVGIKPPPGQQGPGGGVPAHDTWGAWSAAADARHQDGLALVDGERRGGAVYMFGYVAELHLKIAILKSLDHPENNYAFADIVIDNIKKIITSGASGKKPFGYGDFKTHDLPWLLDVLVSVRSGRKKPMPETVVTAMNGLFKDGLAQPPLQDDWSEQLRYTGIDVTKTELERVYAAVESIVKLKDDLWR